MTSFHCALVTRSNSSNRIPLCHRQSAAVSKTVLPRVQQYATTLVHDNDTTVRDDENRINIDLCNGHAGMIHIRAAS
jgi:hypothetical protein